MKRFKLTITRRQLPSRDPVARSLALSRFAAKRFAGNRITVRGTKHKGAAADWEQA